MSMPRTYRIKRTSKKRLNSTEIEAIADWYVFNREKIGLTLNLAKSSIQRTAAGSNAYATLCARVHQTKNEYEELIADLFTAESCKQIAKLVVEKLQNKAINDYRDGLA